MPWRTTFSVILLSAVASGCATAEPSAGVFSESMKSMMPSTGGYRDSTQEEGDGWEIVGKEGRGHMAPDKDPDPWWQQYVMSPKARSVERNLGIH